MNWKTDYKKIIAGMTSAQFTELTANPNAVLGQYGVTASEMEQSSSTYVPPIPPNRTRSESPSCTADVSWWGFTLEFNEASMHLLKGGQGMAGTLSTIIGGALAVVPVVNVAALVVAGAISGAMFLEVSAIELADSGNGVHYNITWVQAAALLVPLINIPAFASIMIPLPN
jgi:hypothetical protein